MCRLGWPKICKFCPSYCFFYRKLLFSNTSRCDDYSNGYRKKQQFIKIALITTIFSVLGGLFGYLIGYVFFNEIGFKIFQFYGYENVDILKEIFSTKKGMFSWFGLLFVVGFTPLPFKILTITSGFIHYNIFVFIFTCVFTRGLRFLLVAFLTDKFGSKIGPFLEKKAGKWTFTIAGVVIFLCAGVYFLIMNK